MMAFGLLLAVVAVYVFAKDWGAEKRLKADNARLRAELDETRRSDGRKR